jgi:hypothetical protein
MVAVSVYEVFAILIQHDAIFMEPASHSQSSDWSMGCETFDLIILPGSCNRYSDWLRAG